MSWPHFSTVTYWGLAAIFVVGVILATGSAFAETSPTHWRFPLWWLALAGTHLARLPVVPLIWLAFLFDAADGFMLFLYAAQPGADPFSLLVVLSPLIILALTVFIWWRGQYSRLSRSKGDPHVQL
ncbi:hypothetical protein C8N43_1849 [Litoreibacter ponti]|uniref:Uncharacterized protein n=1 Tax=Litoreibacter ponti TaxID=1510457 RepID=A0A2T6BM73_9RHOB|nr:hypothetical protein [Litoreibacter ponti]PTX57183.1 hypothetical protein C8N43_1849 [Litoreibacter ponti]